MSLGYAEKLSYREDIGAVGQKELLDSAEEIEAKICELASLVQLVCPCNHIAIRRRLPLSAIGNLMQERMNMLVTYQRIDMLRALHGLAIFAFPLWRCARCSRAASRLRLL
jgi:hypothetical protein